MSHDVRVFLSHAHEDKQELVRPLAEALRERGLEVWYDEFSMKLGDSLRRSIDRGLKECDRGVVIISPRFMKGQWTRRELDALFAKQADGENAILPVWHEISYEEVHSFSPMLADLVAIRSSEGVQTIVDRICEALGVPAQGPGQRISPPSPIGLGPQRDEVLAGRRRSVTEEVLLKDPTRLIFPFVLANHGASRIGGVRITLLTSGKQQAVPSHLTLNNLITSHEPIKGVPAVARLGFSVEEPLGMRIVLHESLAAYEEVEILIGAEGSACAGPLGARLGVVVTATGCPPLTAAFAIQPRRRADKVWNCEVKPLPGPPFRLS